MLAAVAVESVKFKCHYSHNMLYNLSFFKK